MDRVNPAGPSHSDRGEPGRRHGCGRAGRAEQLSQLCVDARQFFLTDCRSLGIRLPASEANTARCALLFRPDGRYRYWGGFNLVAVAWTALGFLFYMFVVPMSWIPALTTLLFTGIGYTMTAMVVASRSQAMAMGSTPVAVAIPHAMPAE